MQLTPELKSNLEAFGNCMGKNIFVHIKPVYIPYKNLGSFTLDSYVIYKGPAWIPCTRFRIPYVSRQPLYFNLSERSMLSTNDANKQILTGERVFDKTFITKGNDPEKISKILSDSDFRDNLLAVQKFGKLWFGGVVLLSQPSAATVHDWGMYTSFWKSEEAYPPGVHELQLTQMTWVRKPEDLFRMLTILVETLEKLIELGVAAPENPNYVIPGIRGEKLK